MVPASDRNDEKREMCGVVIYYCLSAFLSGAVKRSFRYTKIPKGIKSTKTQAILLSFCFNCQPAPIKTAMTRADIREEHPFRCLVGLAARFRGYLLSGHTQFHQYLFPGRSRAEEKGPATEGSLQEAVQSARMQYLYIGDQLGGKPPDSDCYKDESGKADYRTVREKDYFKQGIKRLLEGLPKYRVCIMCAEEDPNLCHRNLLVAETLRQSGVKIVHIRGDGRIEAGLW